MTEKHTIGGFGSKFKPDEPEQQSDKKKEKGPAIEELLVDLLCERYAPAETIQESTEQKTTMDLIDEMESFSDVWKAKLVMVLKAKGFKPYYTGNQFVWLLKEK